MKKFVWFVAALGVLVGLGFFFNHNSASPVAPTDAVGEAASSGPAEPPPAVEPVPPPAQKPKLNASAERPSPHPVAPTVNPALEASFVAQTVDVLVSRQATYQQKQDAWKQLRESGKLEQAIADLEQRTAGDPRIAEYPAALGQAYLKKCGTIQDMREQGILAMQADKLFDTALNLDASNWEARFTKAVGLSYWPPMLNKSEEVIQHFTTLIEQQETQPPQPQFSSTYAWLGEQYQKAGRTDDARAVWQRGAALFPADEQLRAKLASK